MVSIAFLLCSTLLLSGTFAAPYPDATEDIITFTNNNYDLPETISTDISAELQRSLGQEAAQAGVKVLIDVLDGKDVKTSVLDRGIEALGKVEGTLASIGHSFLKRLKELLSGTSIEKVAGNIWKSVQKKLAGRNKKFDEIVEAVGIENVAKFIESATKVIKETIIVIMKKRKEEQALKEITERIANNSHEKNE